MSSAEGGTKTRSDVVCLSFKAGRVGAANRVSVVVPQRETLSTRTPTETVTSPRYLGISSDTIDDPG